MSEIIYKVGDATQPQCDGDKIIAHICNNIGAWGRGFVMAISTRWPSTRQAYSELLKTYGVSSLGLIQLIPVEDHIYVCNMVAQKGIRSTNNPTPIRYAALDECLRKLATVAKEKDATVHMPRIGCGLAGGTWPKVERIINNTLIESGVDVYVYDYEVES